MPNRPTSKQLAAENQDLRAQLEKAEATLREVFSGEVDALLIPNVEGAQLYFLKDSNQSYRALIENMSEGALILTPQGLILYANQRFAQMLRTPLEKVIGSEISHWLAENSRDAIQALLQSETIDKHHEELYLAAADGIQVSVYLSVSHLVLDELDSICMVVTDLTQQKRNEAILAEEKLAHAILEQAADAIVICDGSGRIIRASKQAQAFYGKSLLGKLFEHAFPLLLLDGTAFSSIGSIDAEDSQSVAAMLNYNGQKYNFMVSVGHLRGARGELLGSVVTLTDITESIKTGEEIKFKNTILRTQQEASQDAILLVDENAKIISYNQKFIDMWQVSLKILSAGEDAPVLQAVADQIENSSAFVARVKYLYEHREEKSHDEIRLKDGRIMDRYSAPATGTDGIYYGRVWYFRDITDRKQAADNLAANEALLKEFIMHTPAAIAMLDMQMRYIQTSERWMQDYKLVGQDIIGKSHYAIFPEISQRWKDIHQSVLAGAIETCEEDPFPRADGSTDWLQWEARPWYQSGDNIGGLILFTQVITERKKAEASIKYLNRVLSVLSGINTLIVRVNSREELFREACNIAVDAGGFRMAMIVIVDQGTMLPNSIVSAGKDEKLLTDLKDAMSTSKGMQTTLIAQAIREKKAVVANNTQDDSELLFGKQYAEAGINSKLVLPLIVSGEVVGTLVLYASEIEFFRGSEVELLTELAGDIAYAIDHIDKQERLNYLAYYDVLTGLANRTLFLERVDQFVRSADSGGHKLAIGLIDLERFKNINDSLGRGAGDSLLQQVAQWLTQFMQSANLLARIDADHFAFVVPKITTDSNLARSVENLVTALQEQSFSLNDAMYRINIKVGIALFPDDGADADILFRNAEAALKKAKASGDRYLFYTRKMTAAVADKLSLENQLRRAIDNEEFELYYQPKVNLASGKVTSAEVLIRWNDPRTGLVPPAKFIPTLEETGLIYHVGRWALHKAIENNLRWRVAGLPAIRIAVNVSPLQLRNANFVDEIRQVISLDEHAADSLELEITESLIMENVELSITSLQAIRALGVTIAIDDFGTGFSSLNYLSKLPVDTLKIDTAFVNKMTTPEGVALVSTIIILAHALKLKVVAEGVETQEQSRQLLSLNCDEMQGFLFSKPVPADVFEARFLTLAQEEVKK